MRFLNGFLAVLMISLLMAGGYYAHDRYVGDLTAQTRTLHQALGEGFSETLWKGHRDKIQTLLVSGRSNLSDEIDVAVLASDITRYVSGASLMSVQLYGPKQQLITAFAMGTNPPPVLPSAQRLAEAISATSAIAKAEGVGWGHMIVQTAVPLDVSGQRELVLWFTSDVSPQLAAYHQQIASVMAVMLVFLALVGLFVRINVRRAENVIARQFEENTQLAAQANIAKEENMQKSQFLANITHELRTPLNAIIGFSDILKNEFVPAPGQSNHTNYIHDIHSAGTHLLSLINDILDYSKAEAGKLELEATEVNAIKMIQNCMRLIQPRAEIAQVRVLESLPTDQVILNTDGKKFKQVLLNLLSNAVKFTPANGTVKVSAWLDMREDCWVFEVRDTGIGIAPKDISRAMAPFGQVDNALSRKFEGTGLGLPLTKKFVELMGGKFSIDSELNKGTTVTFSLPREYKPQEGVVVKQVA